MVENLPANAGDMDSIPGSGRDPGEGNGNPLQYSACEGPERGESSGLQSAGSQSLTKLSAHTFHHCRRLTISQLLLGQRSRAAMSVLDPGVFCRRWSFTHVGTEGLEGGSGRS